MYRKPIQIIVVLCLTIVAGLISIGIPLVSAQGGTVLVMAGDNTLSLELPKDWIYADHINDSTMFQFANSSDALDRMLKGESFREPDVAGYLYIFSASDYGITETTDLQAKLIDWMKNEGKVIILEGLASQLVTTSGKSGALLAVHKNDGMVTLSFLILFDNDKLVQGYITGSVDGLTAVTSQINAILQSIAIPAKTVAAEPTPVIQWCGTPSEPSKNSIFFVSSDQSLSMYLPEGWEYIDYVEKSGLLVFGNSKEAVDIRNRQLSKEQVTLVGISGYIGIYSAAEYNVTKAEDLSGVLSGWLEGQGQFLRSSTPERFQTYACVDGVRAMFKETDGMISYHFLMLFPDDKLVYAYFSGPELEATDDRRVVLSVRHLRIPASDDYMSK